ncbi:hypothetical protein [Pseudonocardia charpentierae]|uniref:Uncharacterized protein n=1 Tax=Pseudonocardia charpentierae TaxID=3075545 RepID=A0ABU2NB06_9PSEU|nr:hypothetical protein [Pseudonocardia sp. DSM 45834]MDT0351116.1 hypothetical protein [Pseudonocardia sp. DSM 45834]
MEPSSCGSELPRRRLRDLAEKAGFNVASLAAMIEVNEATLYRVWLSETWDQEIESINLKRLLSVIPGATEYYAASVFRERSAQVVQLFQKSGFALNMDELDRALAGGITPQYLLNSLESVYHVLRGDQDRAIKHLQAAWGLKQSRALDVACGNNPNFDILKDRTELQAAMRDVLSKLLARRGYSFPRTLAEVNLAHQLGKASGDVAEQADAKVRKNSREEKYGFMLRGSYMGALRQADDLDLARRYKARVERSGIVKVVESWAFPTWTGDYPVRSTFELPSEVRLTHTATEVIHEVREYNDAYVWYLVTTFIPLALETIDPKFGNQLRNLADALDVRAEATSMKELAEEARQLSKQIRRTSEGHND